MFLLKCSLYPTKYGHPKTRTITFKLKNILEKTTVKNYQTNCF